MNTLSLDQATKIVKEAVVTIAPDVEGEIDDVDGAADLWDVLELDSMDHLNVMTELSEQTGVEIAERDYGRLRSVETLAAHLVAAAAA